MATPHTTGKRSKAAGLCLIVLAAPNLSATINKESAFYDTRQTKIASRSSAMPRTGTGMMLHPFDYFSHMTNPTQSSKVSEFNEQFIALVEFQGSKLSIPNRSAAPAFAHAAQPDTVASQNTIQILESLTSATKDILRQREGGGTERALATLFLGDRSKQAAGTVGAEPGLFAAAAAAEGPGGGFSGPPGSGRPGNPRPIRSDSRDLLKIIGRWRISLKSRQKELKNKVWREMLVNSIKEHTNEFKKTASTSEFRKKYQLREEEVSAAFIVIDEIVELYKTYAATSKSKEDFTVNIELALQFMEGYFSSPMSLPELAVKLKDVSKLIPQDMQLPSEGDSAGIWRLIEDCLKFNYWDEINRAELAKYKRTIEDSTREAKKSIAFIRLDITNIENIVAAESIIALLTEMHLQTIASVGTADRYLAWLAQPMSQFSKAAKGQKSILRILDSLAEIHALNMIKLNPHAYDPRTEDVLAEFTPW